MGKRFHAFMVGRNGADSLYIFCLALCAGLLLLNSFLRSIWLTAAVVLLLGYSFFRAMSRNVSRRRREEMAFRHFFGRIGGFFRLCYYRVKYRKTHVFCRCPGCKKTLRLRKISGEHTAKCPVCGRSFSVRTGKKAPADKCRADDGGKNS